MKIELTNKFLYTTLLNTTKYKDAFKLGLQIAFWMHSKKTAYAISANQIGFTLRLFVVNKRIKQVKNMNDIYINPSYEGIGEKFVNEERCLSFPGKVFKIERFKSIYYEYYDPREKEYLEGQFDGFPALVFQHECDHLDGKPDNVTAIK